jgi:hypothetical protein
VKAERDEARNLVDQMVEQVSDGNAVIERWKEPFDMILNDKGMWTWDPFIQRYDDLVSRYNERLAKWNRFVPTYNANVAPQPIGCPLDASSAQCAVVLKLAKLVSRSAPLLTKPGFHCRPSERLSAAMGVQTARQPVVCNAFNRTKRRRTTSALENAQGTPYREPWQRRGEGREAIQRMPKDWEDSK